MTKGRILMAAGLFVLVLVLVVGGAVIYALTRDPVDMRYATMAIAVEDQCKPVHGKETCAALAKCYAEGVETAFPRDLLAEIVEKGRQVKVPPEVEKAHAELQVNCRKKVGITEAG